MATSAATPTTITLVVDGLSCGACERHVAQALEAVPGVTGVSVDRRARSAVVTGGARLDAGVLVDAVRAAGYDADVARTSDEPPATPAAAGGDGCCGCCEVTA